MFNRKLGLLVAAGVLAAALAGCGGGAKDSGAPKITGDVTKGQVAFENTCISCHGNDAKGLPGSGKDLVKRSEWMKKQDDAALVAFIKQGRPVGDAENTTQVDMPPKGGNPALTDEDINNIVVFLRDLQAKAGQK
jgi:mono/diheme cytochrome c family protein